jgi:hypothetical protein
MKLRDVLIRIVAFNVLPGLTVVAINRIAVIISAGTYAFDEILYFHFLFHQRLAPSKKGYRGVLRRKALGTGCNKFNRLIFCFVAGEIRRPLMRVCLFSRGVS